VLDFYIQLGLSVFFQILSERKLIKQYSKALRKAYIILHANRLLFLSDGDFQTLGQDKPEAQ